MLCGLWEVYEGGMCKVSCGRVWCYVDCHFTMQLFKRYIHNCFNVGFQLFSIGQKKLNQERYVYQTV